MIRHFIARVFLATTGLTLLGCTSTPAQPPTEPPVTEAPPAEPPASETPPVEAPADAAPPASEPSAPEGRLAFTQCDPANRPQACTREYRPVCGEVDTGVRCVKAPCPSTQQKTFGNACTACSEAKTTGYWPVACEELNKADTSAPAP
jgi:hypothetical protein